MMVKAPPQKMMVKPHRPIVSFIVVVFAHIIYPHMLMVLFFSPHQIP